jgi:translation initiation factor 2 subunit 3
MTDLNVADPGGLLGISTELDPTLTKSDRLAGNVLGTPGKLPPVLQKLTLNARMLERVVGAKEELKMEPIKAGDVVMLTTGVVRTVGAVTQAGGERIDISLKMPVCTDKGERVAISKQILGRWRLVGWGEIA